MNKSTSDRQTGENEVVFRRANERVQQGFHVIKEMAKEDGHDGFVANHNIPLHFYCECSDENCRQRIIMDPLLYENIHADRSKFVIIPGHETDSIEKIITKKPDYFVVKKFIKPPEDVTELKETDVDNV